MSSTSESWQHKDEFWFNVTFIYRTEQHSHQSVCLAGDFNGWSTTSHSMKPSSEGYSITLPLSEGFYYYKFLVDGQLVPDPDNPHRGGEYANSIMFVHMDPHVHGLRAQAPPHRDYHRSNWSGEYFHMHCPSIPADIAACGVLQRQIFVFLPPSYRTHPTQRYPVVYANDGQNLFSTPEGMGGPCGGGWYMDARCDHYWREGLLPEFIVVAVPNSDFVCIGNRTREYCTADFSDTSCDPYIRYLTEVVKREIDQNYRTLPEPQHTVALGASMGGLCAFVCAVTQCDVFGSAVCMSPSFWYVDKHNWSAYHLVKSRSQPPCRLYIDSGDGLGDNCYETKLMADTLTKCGWSEFSYQLDECASHAPHGVTHCEGVWGGRLLAGLKYVLNDHD